MDVIHAHEYISTDNIFIHRYKEVLKNEYFRINIFLYHFAEIMHMRYSTKPRRMDENLGWFTLIINTSLCPSVAASKCLEHIL